MTHSDVPSPSVRLPLPADGVYYRACNLCEAICGLELTVKGGEVVDVRGDASDPLSKGHICPKGAMLPDLHRDPDRLKRPLRRDGTTWTEMEWEEALDYVVERLKAVQAQHGPDAVGVYQGNPSVHNSGTLLSAGGFLKALGTRNFYSATSVDQLPHHRAALEMLGHPLLLPIPDVDRTDFLLMMGANPAASNGSILTAPGLKERLKAIHGRGGRVVLLDPRRTESAAYAEHHFIRPGTDAALLLSLLHVIFAEQLEKPGRLLDFTDGLDALRAAALPYSPEAVAQQTGLDAGFIRTLARDFASASSAVAYGRIGLSTQAFGGLCQWLLNALNIVTGNFDREGGAMLPLPAFDQLMRAKKGERPLHRYASRVRGLPEFDGEFPSAALAEEMDTPGAGQIRAFISVAGNPVLSTPDGARLDRALEGLEFMVSIDPYLNETTRHADVILPPATGLETEHYDVIFHHFAVRNTARLNPAIFPVGADQRFDWQIFGGLRERLTGARGSDPAARLALGLKHGPYKLELDALKAAPHGLDFGPMKPCLPQRLLNEQGRIQLAPESFLNDLPRLDAALSTPVPAFVLIGRRQLRSNNSWMHNTPRLMRGTDRCTLMLHPDDAAKLGVAAGEQVTVTSRVGSVTVPAEVTDTLMPGVVSLPHGFGHGKRGTRLSVAQQHPGASYNDLSDPLLLDELTGNAAVSGVPVEVAKAAQRVEVEVLSAD
ncbi:molybdopterin oxidoreductase family protein [Deinococcus sp. KNUC1210]|uniref:molybdopterin oxidoreductase family protein n=1 Tax=Deinococcus sp. KNUC1210 TaxID=2917691 RepID=UPI001EF10A51|nr:molybdopterin oxidoreductase family protein [Deinococcus sp. KNUC1210]ULH15181.1 molybdopterin oxidoreductase family protein [Deinococcus sp. KNUC1210]